MQALKRIGQPSERSGCDTIFWCPTAHGGSQVPAFRLMVGPSSEQSSKNGSYRRGSIMKRSENSGRDHPISITDAGATGTCQCERRGSLAESSHALRLEEKEYPPVYYIPREDVDMVRCSFARPTIPMPLQGRLHLLQHSHGCAKWSSPSGHTKNRMRQVARTQGSFGVLSRTSRRAIE